MKNRICTYLKTLPLLGPQLVPCFADSVARFSSLFPALSGTYTNQLINFFVIQDTLKLSPILEIEESRQFINSDSNGLMKKSRLLRIVSTRSLPANEKRYIDETNFIRILTCEITSFLKKEIVHKCGSIIARYESLLDIINKVDIRMKIVQMQIWLRQDALC